MSPWVREGKDQWVLTGSCSDNGTGRTVERQWVLDYRSRTEAARPGWHLSGTYFEHPRWVAYGAEDARYIAFYLICHSLPDPCAPARPWKALIMGGERAAAMKDSTP